MAEWLKDAVFYEIYPQSFQDTNADGIGDFQGIIDHLDYIKELGCNAIWMNPCFESPFGDAGYDVSDYYTAAPRYGTNEDLKRLFDEVHKRECIFFWIWLGHTSVEHPWFKESLKAQKIHIPIAIFGQIISGSSQRALPPSRVFQIETVVVW